MVKINNILSQYQRAFKRWDRRLTISKRQQFVVLVAGLTVGLILTQLASLEVRYPLVMVLSLLAYGTSAFALREDLRGIEWLSLLILPTLFTAAVSLFYFLLPVRWLTRVPVAALYGLGMYALLLTENIYNVAANRTIGLLRAAHTVGFLITLVTNFLLINTVLAFRFFPLYNSLIVGILAFLLIFQALWSIELSPTVGRRVWQLSLTLSVIMSELTLVFSFWPIKTTMLALFLTTCLYSLVGMAQQYIADKLYKKTVSEFLWVSLIVFILVMLTTRWRGNF